MKLRSALIKLYSSVFGSCTRLVSDRAYIRTLYFLSYGKFPSLSAPKSFNEHICAIKLSDDSLRLSSYTDKYAVRDYVEKTIGARYLTPIFGVYDRFSDIPFDAFPQRFALKATHASGYNMIVEDKALFDHLAAEKKFAVWLSKNYYEVGREKNYKNVQPRILAESFLNFSQPLTEYKFYCFRGTVRMIAVHRFSRDVHTVTVYDPQWTMLDVRLGYPSEEALPQPKAMTDMLECAKKLSAQFDFVRVDLYADGDDVRFSELTFTPGGGLVHTDPADFELTMGSWFEK